MGNLSGGNEHIGDEGVMSRTLNSRQKRRNTQFFPSIEDIKPKALFQVLSFLPIRDVFKTIIFLNRHFYKTCMSKQLFWKTLALSHYNSTDIELKCNVASIQEIQDSKKKWKEIFFACFYSSLELKWSNPNSDPFIRLTNMNKTLRILNREDKKIVVWKTVPLNKTFRVGGSYSATLRFYDGINNGEDTKKDDVTTAEKNEKNGNIDVIQNESLSNDEKCIFGVYFPDKFNVKTDIIGKNEFSYGFSFSNGQIYHNSMVYFKSNIKITSNDKIKCQIDLKNKTKRKLKFFKNEDKAPFAEIFIVIGFPMKFAVSMKNGFQNLSIVYE